MWLGRQIHHIRLTSRFVYRPSRIVPTSSPLSTASFGTSTSQVENEDTAYFKQKFAEECNKPLPTQPSIRRGDDEALESVLIENTVEAREKLNLNPSQRDPTGMYSAAQLQLMVESTQDLYESGKYMKAAEILREVLRHDPNHHHATILIVQMNLACIPSLMLANGKREGNWTQESKENNARAIGLMREALRYAPREPEVHAALGLALSRSAKETSGHDEAIAHLRRAVSLSEESDGTRNAELALLAALQKKAEDTASQWANINSKDQDETNGRNQAKELLLHAESAMNSCIEIAEEMNDADLAKTEENTSFSLNDARLTHAELLRQSGDLSTAVSRCRDAVASMKTSDEVESILYDDEMNNISDTQATQTKYHQLHQRALVAQLFGQIGIQMLHEGISKIDALSVLTPVSDAVSVLQECKDVAKNTEKIAKSLGSYNGIDAKTVVNEQLSIVKKLIHSACEPLFLQGWTLCGDPATIARQAQGNSVTETKDVNINPIAAAELLRLSISLMDDNIESRVALANAMIASATYYDKSDSFEAEAAAVAQFREAWKFVDCNNTCNSFINLNDNSLCAAVGWNETARRKLIANGRVTMASVIARHALNAVGGLSHEETKNQLLESVEQLRRAISEESRFNISERTLCHWEIYLDAAQFAFQAQDFDQTMTLVRGGLAAAGEENAPPAGFTHLQCLLGHTQRKMNLSVDEAIDSYRRALNVKNGGLGKLGIAEVPTRLGLGVLLHKKGIPVEAAKAFRGVLAQAEQAVEGVGGELVQGSGIPITNAELRQARVGFGMAVMDAQPDAETVLDRMEREEENRKTGKTKYVEADTLTLSVAEQQMEIELYDAAASNELDQSLLQAQLSLGFLAAARQNVLKCRERFLGAIETSRNIAGGLENVTSMQAHLGLQVMYKELGMNDESKHHAALAADAKTTCNTTLNNSSQSSLDADFEQIRSLIQRLRYRIRQEEGTVESESKNSFSGNFKQFQEEN